MTPLRKQMDDYMSLKNFSKNNIESYIGCIAELAKFYNKSPDKLSNDEVQKYLLYLQNNDNLSRDSYDIANSAILFFFNKFLKDEAVKEKSSPQNKEETSITLIYDGKNINPYHVKMMNEMKFRRFSESTIRLYNNSVNGLAKFYNNIPLDQISNDQIQEYLLYLQEERKLAWSTCNIVSSGLLFFYNNVLSDKNIKLKFSPKKRKKSLPDILSRSDIEALLNSTSNLRDRVMLMTIYSSGLRVGELVKLKIDDIDSKRMTIRVVDSKGNKDRYTILSTKLLKALRIYYESYRPKQYMFTSIDRDKHITISTVQRIFTKAKTKANIKKGNGIHLLRHNAEFQIMPSIFIRY